MKKLLQISLLALFPCAGFCENTLPREAAQAEQQYNQAVARLTESYVKRLKEIMDVYTKAGDLDGAIKIKEEIERHSVADSQSLKPAMGKTYSWTANGRNAGNRLKLLADGKGTFARSQVSWEQVGERSVRIFMGKITHEIEFSKSFDSFDGIALDGRTKIKGQQIE